MKAPHNAFAHIHGKTHKFVAVHDMDKDPDPIPRRLYRCRICRLQVRGLLATSSEQLASANLPALCEDWIVRHVMES